MGKQKSFTDCYYNNIHKHGGGASGFQVVPASQ